MSMEELITIYTDGACRPSNPGPGGCACILLYKGNRKELTLSFKETTNSRMELMAVIMALEALKKKDIKIQIHADATYKIKSITKKWVYTWEKEKWRGRLNADLWKRFLAIHRTFTNTVEFIWVKGHTGDVENENCDKLANGAACGSEIIDTGYISKS